MPPILITIPDATPEDQKFMVVQNSAFHHQLDGMLRRAVTSGDGKAKVRWRTGIKLRVPSNPNEVRGVEFQQTS